MQRNKSIWLLLIMGLILFPWSFVTFCYKEYQEAHPPPDHIHGLCHLRKTFNGTAYWPPMACKVFKMDISKFLSPDQETLGLPSITVNSAISVFTANIQLAYVDKNFPRTRAPPHSIDPSLTAHYLRGPPFV